MKSGSPQEKEAVEKIISDFLRLKRRKNPGSQEEMKLIRDITGLIGIYSIDPNKQLEKTIDSMVDFGKKQRWAMQGVVIEFNRIKKKLA